MEPKAPQTCGGEALTARLGFFTISKIRNNSCVMVGFDDMPWVEIDESWGFSIGMMHKTYYFT